MIARLLLGKKSGVKAHLDPFNRVEKVYFRWPQLVDSSRFCEVSTFNEVSTFDEVSSDIGHQLRTCLQSIRIRDPMKPLKLEFKLQLWRLWGGLKTDGETMPVDAASPSQKLMRFSCELCL